MLEFYRLFQDLINFWMKVKLVLKNLFILLLVQIFLDNTDTEEQKLESLAKLSSPTFLMLKITLGKMSIQPSFHSTTLSAR